MASQQPETRFIRRIRPKLRALPNTWFEKIQQVGISGTPDFLLCVGGYFVALEIKKDKFAKVSKLQKRNLERIRKAGGLGIIVFPENWTTVYKALQDLAGAPFMDNANVSQVS